jgi:hypothetical protein
MEGQGVVVYAVKTDGTREEWVKFINEHKLTGVVTRLPVAGEAGSRQRGRQTGIQANYTMFTRRRC